MKTATQEPKSKKPKQNDEEIFKCEKCDTEVGKEYFRCEACNTGTKNEVEQIHEDSSRYDIDDIEIEENTKYETDNNREIGGGCPWCNKILYENETCEDCNTHTTNHRENKPAIIQEVIERENKHEIYNIKSGEKNVLATRDNTSLENKVHMKPTHDPGQNKNKTPAKNKNKNQEILNHKRIPRQIMKTSSVKSATQRQIVIRNWISTKNSYTAKEIKHTQTKQTIKKVHRKPLKIKTQMKKKPEKRRKIRPKRQNRI